MTHRWSSIRRLALALALAACAPPARPPALARVAQVRASPAAADAETWAPQAHAHAVELEERAERALKDGDAEAADLIAEQAIAAHEHAWVLTRLARAERRRLTAEAELDTQQGALGDLRAQHQRLTAEAAALELRSQTVQAALPLPPYETATPERQLARRRAAASLSAQARLLCLGARLLGEAEHVAPLIARLDELDQKLGGGTAPKLLEAAADLRTECLRVISQVRQRNVAPAARPSSAPAASAGPVVAANSGPARGGVGTEGSVSASGGSSASAEPAESGPDTSGPRASSVARVQSASPATPGSPSAVAGKPSLGGPVTLPAGVGPVPADVVLDELSAAGASPARDERGVAVALRDLFAPGGTLTEGARAQLERLAQVAARHPDFPLLLVGHSASARGAADVDRDLDAATRALSALATAKITVWSVGDREPLLPPRSALADARNRRLELVFVAPGF